MGDKLGRTLVVLAATGVGLFLLAVVLRYCEV